MSKAKVRSSASGLYLKSRLPFQLAHHKQDALRGLMRFQEIFTTAGAQCTTLSFRTTSDWTPLTHAKAIFADSSHAYIGSADLTSNGFDGSVELGVVFHGLKATQLASWMRALSSQLAPWRA